MSIHRYKDPGSTKWKYLQEIVVQCPSCLKPALVKKEKGTWYNDEAELLCHNCHHRQSKPPKLYDLEVKLYCYHCTGRINNVIRGVSIRKDLINIKCPSCKISQKYKPRYIERAKELQETNGVRDPFYHLPLWLSAAYKNDFFWAYNYEHLSDIKRHVAAKIRTKIENGYTTMLERLPSWITSKKNRDGILKLIEKLERK